MKIVNNRFPNAIMVKDLQIGELFYGIAKPDEVFIMTDLGDEKDQNERVAVKLTTGKSVTFSDFGTVYVVEGVLTLD